MGSVPLATPRRVPALGKGAGRATRRIPDGETGGAPTGSPGSTRTSAACRSSSPARRTAPPTARCRSGATGRALRRPGLREPRLRRCRDPAYATFARLKEEGAIRSGCRMLVSLPTPLAPVSAFVALENQAALSRPTRSRCPRGRAVVAAIPAAELAIQWDARYEFAMLEGAIAVWFPRSAPASWSASSIGSRCPRASSRLPPLLRHEEHGHSASRPTPATSWTCERPGPRPRAPARRIHMPGRAGDLTATSHR